MSPFDIQSAFEQIKNETAEIRVKEQRKAKGLLFESMGIKSGLQSQDTLDRELQEILSESSSLCP